MAQGFRFKAWGWRLRVLGGGGSVMVYGSGAERPPCFFKEYTR